MICCYGCEQEAVFTLWGKKPCCSSNVSKCPAIRDKISQKSSQQVGVKRNWTRSHPWKGKTNEEIHGSERAKEISENISKSLTGRIFQFKSSETRDSYVEKARQRIRKRHDEGWQPRAGRCRKIRYHSAIAGEVVLDGKWELLVAKHLDKLGLAWTRNKVRFSYTNLLQKQSWYTPDFFVKEWNSYLEVKGFQTPLDICK